MERALAEKAFMTPASMVSPETAPAQPVHRGVQPEDLYDALGTLLPDTDELKHENDVLLIANTALEEFGVKSISEFAEWLARQEMLCKRNNMWEAESKHFPAPPAITQIAKFLRETQRMRQTASGR